MYRGFRNKVQKLENLMNDLRMDMDGIQTVAYSIFDTLDSADKELLDDAFKEFSRLKEKHYSFFKQSFDHLNDLLYTSLPNFCRDKLLMQDLSPKTVGSIVNVELSKCIDLHHVGCPEETTVCFLRTDGKGMLYAVPVASITAYCPKGVSFIIPRNIWDTAIHDLPDNTIKKVEEAIKHIDYDTLNALMGLEE